MTRQPEKRCVPLEVEMVPLYRDPPGTARLRRERKREQRLARGRVRGRVRGSAATRVLRWFGRLAHRPGS